MPSDSRDIIKKTYALILASTAVPANYQETTVETYLNDTDATKVTLLAGASMNPSTSVSPNDTEGNNVVQSLDISDGGTWNLIANTVSEYQALRTKYNDQEVRIASLTGNPDVIYPSGGSAFVATAGDELEISHVFKVKIFLNNVDGGEKQAQLTFSKSVDPDLDTVPIYDAVVADP